MKDHKALGNLVTMVQSDAKAKTFRKDYPVSESLREEMVKVFREFMIYTLNNHYNDENLLMLNEFIEDHYPKLEKRQSLLDNLFWWKIMHKSERKKFMSCFEEYLSDNIIRFKTRPFMNSWLRECDKVVSKFYFIGHQYNDRNFVAVDILTREPLDVIVCDPTALPPKQGELAAGTLLPLGGGLYFPIIDFYHFNYNAREAIASCLQHHYDKYLKNFSMHEAFLHVLSVMLQIEKTIDFEK